MPSAQLPIPKTALNRKNLFGQPEPDQESGSGYEWQRWSRQTGRNQSSGVGLNRMGYKIGVLDADITGPSIPRTFGLEGGNLKATDFGIVPPVSSKGIKIISVNLFLPGEDEPVIWRGPLLAGMVKQFWEETDWRELDYLLVDLPPGTGDVPLTVMQSLPLDGTVVVSSPQELSMVVKKVR